MAETLYARLLSPDSILLPTITAESIAVVAELVDDQRYHPLFAITCELAGQSYQIQADYYFDQQTHNSAFDLNADYFADFIAGFRTPLVVIFSCYFLFTSLFDRNSEPKNNSQYIKRARANFFDLVENCPSDNIASVATNIFTYCEDNPFIDNDYYRVGVTAALTTFREFIEPNDIWEV